MEHKSTADFKNYEKWSVFLLPWYSTLKFWHNIGLQGGITIICKWSISVNIWLPVLENMNYSDWKLEVPTKSEWKSLKRPSYLAHFRVSCWFLGHDELCQQSSPFAPHTMSMNFLDQDDENFSPASGRTNALHPGRQLRLQQLLLVLQRHLCPCCCTSCAD